MNFPHNYQADASAQVEGNVHLSCSDCTDLESAPPKEFGGPGNLWSPEDLLVAAVADCFVLSFRAVAGMSKYTWKDLACEVTGELDKSDTGVQFVGFKVKASLVVDGDADVERAKSLLQKAKGACFITNSLKAPAELEVEVTVA